MEENVFVEYPNPPRDVFVDGARWGKTGDIITVETGTHTFDLGMPQDYMPSAITKQVTGTTPLGPCVIHFDPKVGK